MTEEITKHDPETMTDMWLKYAIYSMDKLDAAATRDQRIWAANDVVTCAQALKIHAEQLRDQVREDEGEQNA